MSSLIRLLLLLCICVVSVKPVHQSSDSLKKDWWETTLVYQIWPRAFQDSDGDGEGDLKGIISRLDYIKSLGVETICLNPIYQSPLIDGGYDISNYTAVNSLFGNLDDFDDLIQEAHNRGLKVILDVVPNHSSDQHKWFRLSARNIHPYNDFYIWADGTTNKFGDRMPPNNWVSAYSDEKGSAWTWHDRRKQWYYHRFHESEPDLNLRNNDVIKELLEIFNFWLERGTDGFRINSVSYFFEDPRLRNESAKKNKSYTVGLRENVELLYIFREHIDNWVKDNDASSKFLIAQSDDHDDEMITYYGNDTHAGIPPLNVRLIKQITNKSDADFITIIIEEWLSLIPKNLHTNWVLSTHDDSRAASRISLKHIDGFNMLAMLLPGQAFTYYGEEIAMLDVTIPLSKTLDPMSCVRVKDQCENRSRDRARTPMQWNSEISAGFSTNNTTYLPIHPDYTERNVDAQLDQKRSHIKTYKMLATLRKEPVFTHGEYQLTTLNDNHVLILARFLHDFPFYIVVINMSPQEERVNLTTLYPYLEDTLAIVTSSINAINVDGSISRDSFILTENAAVLLKGQIESPRQIETSTEALIYTTEEETISTITEEKESEKTTIFTDKDEFFNVLPSSLSTSPESKISHEWETTATSSIPESSTEMTEDLPMTTELSETTNNISATTVFIEEKNINSSANSAFTFQSFVCLILTVMSLYRL